jgi:hypothetical protein
VSTEHGIRFLPSVAALALQSLGQHRLLSARQVQVLHLPGVSLRYTQRVLAELQRAGLADRARAAHGVALWFATAEGRLLLRAKSRLEAQGDRNAVVADGRRVASAYPCAQRHGHRVRQGRAGTRR